jgi:hypothetical protein
MSAGHHIPPDRLAALALAVRAPDTDGDRQTLAHLAACDACSSTLAGITATTDALRDAAWDEADRIFDDAALETARARILDRILHLGKAARVLRFPSRAREAAMPVSQVSRRWISVAAAAGLIIGLVAGQTLHFVPWDAAISVSAPSLRQAQPARSDGVALLQPSTPLSTDDELLVEIDEAVQLRRAASLRALDAFTPLTEIH